jgi:hypothetical protein
MSHPDIFDAEPATTTEEAFRTMWAPRGWELADEALLAAEGVLGQPVPSLEGLKKAELLEVAANLGLDGIDKSWKNDEIIAAIQETTAAPAAETEA